MVIRSYFIIFDILIQRMFKEKLYNKSLGITLKTYILTLSVFSFFRIILFSVEHNKLENGTLNEIFQAFIMGVRFDTVITGYIFILPYLILTILSYFQIQSKVPVKIIFYFSFTLFSAAFLVCAADIPYFSQFFARFSISAFEWMDNPDFVFKMIAEEPKYWLYLIPFLGILYLFHKFYKKFIFRNFDQKNRGNLMLNITLNILMLGFMFIGIRGRVEKKSPIRIGTAYFCNNAFLNQLGLNPNFTLLRSYIDSKKEENQEIKLMDDQQALANMQQFLNIQKIDPNFPIARNYSFDSVTNNKPNIIFIIMESMSAAKMKRHGNTQKLTPFLDSLSKSSIYFENTYTAGIHTFNGIFSTLFSYPALFRKHPLKDLSMTKYHGIATTLKAHQYSTTYFTTHDAQFDNVEGFLKNNDFETIISKKDYPADKVKTTLGVPDDYMFEFAITKLNKLAKQKSPFFTTFMTSSDHGPYYIPPYFKPKTKDIKTQIVEYADFALNKFIQLAKKQTWFKNTVFVFIADHGAPLRNSYEIPLDYVHSPLIFYAPYLLKSPITHSKIASQIDVFPSILGLLNLKFTNNTLGINLFSENRPYAIINGDDKVGIIDNEWLLIINQDKRIGLYHHKNNDPKNYAAVKPELVGKMKKYGESNLQCYQYLLKNKKV